MRRFSIASSLLLAASLLVSAPVFAADSYKVDPVHSSLIFKVTHNNLDHIYGLIESADGQFSIDAADATKDSFSFSAKTDSVHTNNPKRDEHLKSPDFLNAAEFPTISFKSTSVAKDGNNLKVTGDLTLHGVTKSITVNIEKVGEGKGMQGEPRIGYETKFTINRSDYGIKTFVPVVSDAVELTFSFQGIKQ